MGGVVTKLEAWKAWCATGGTERLADQFTLENSSHGKAFSHAWDAAHEACAQICDAKSEHWWAKWKHQADPFDQGASDAADECAQAIRSRK